DEVCISLRIVTLENNTRLSPNESEAALGQIKRAMSRTRLAEPSPDDLANELGDRVKYEYQNRGYFLADVTARLIPVLESSTRHTYDAVVTVLNEGQQYRLQELHFSNVKLFSDAQLRSAIPIHQGDIFSREKIAAGLDNLRKLYGSRGYINFTPLPDTTIDEEHGLILLTIDVEEGKQYTFGELSLPGLDARHSRKLRSEWNNTLRGQPYWIAAVEKFFRQQFRMPSDPYPLWEDPEITRRRINDDSHTVDYEIRFVPNALVESILPRPRTSDHQ
ncbi:MAG TPA: POTRA domain-containing protein, partial [Terriglobales bacterium]